MSVEYQIELQYQNFAAKIFCEDLGELISNTKTRGELIALLDKHMVLHFCPEKELTKPVVGNLAFAFDYPKDRTNPRNIPIEKSDAPGFEFIGNFSAKAKPNLPEPRTPSYIESLHYDGISRASVHTSFHTPATTPNLWSDMRAAYANLPMDLRNIIDKRFALHAVIPPPNTPLAEFPDFDPKTAVKRPLVIKHPRTLEPLLYLPKNPASKIEGMDDKEGREILHELWAYVNTSPTRYASTIGHNESVIWDGLGTTHTNPAYPRDKDRTSWFFIIPAERAEVDAFYV